MLTYLVATVVKPKLLMAFFLANSLAMSTAITAAGAVFFTMRVTELRAETVQGGATQKDLQQDDRMDYEGKEVNRRFDSIETDRKEKRREVSEFESNTDRRLTGVEGDVKFLYGGGAIGLALVTVLQAFNLIRTAPEQFRGRRRHDEENS